MHNDFMYVRFGGMRNPSKSRVICVQIVVFLFCFVFCLCFFVCFFVCSVRLAPSLGISIHH